mgnify:CR=1 FL=1
MNYTSSNISRDDSVWQMGQGQRKAVPVTKRNPTFETWGLLLLGCAVLAVLLWPVYPENDAVAFVGLFSLFTAFAVAIMMNPYYPAVPQFTVALFGVQHVVCPLVYYHYPDLAVAFPVTPAFMETFRLSCWATAIFAASVLVVTAGCSVQSSAIVLRQALSRRHRVALINWAWTVWLGTSLLTLVMRGFPIAALAFLWFLFLSLQVVSMCVLIYLLPKQKCKKFVILVIAVHTIFALQTTFFSHIALASAIALLLLAHRFQWRVKLVLILLGGLIVSAAIQNEKDEFRDIAWYGRGRSFSLSERLDFWAEELPTELKTLSSGMTIHKVWPIVERLNQAKIIEQVVRRTPEEEPLANGETFVMATKLIIPRLLWQEKPVDYSRIIFRKYTGYPLEAVSMGVGFLGEFYLNFGEYALLGFFVYSLSIALISRYWIKMGSRFPLWWAWFFYVMNYWIRFEIDFAKALNYTVKAAFVFACLVVVSRLWQRALGFSKGSAVRRRKHPIPENAAECSLQW